MSVLISWSACRRERPAGTDSLNVGEKTVLYAAVAELCYLAVSKEMLKHRETLMLREEKGKDRNDLRIHLG